MKVFLKSTFFRRFSDLLLSPVTLFSAVWYKYIRSGSTTSMPVSEKIFMKVGVLPVSDHYYQPMINPVKHLARPLHEDRRLPGINWNMDKQLQLMNRFNYSAELDEFAFQKPNDESLQFYYDNPSLGPGDASFLYNMIRCYKPKKIIEIGCGYSTLLALKSEQKNMLENSTDVCEHFCIEPYEMPWLEKLKVTVIRKKVEELDRSFFSRLSTNDILFIDSSHIIRPQGDVLFEFLEIIPNLNPGVLIHVHDIFSPKDYPKEWIIDKHCFWNEQYLLEAFLTCNTQFTIIGAVNYLKHNHSALFEEKCPASKKIQDDEPGSFWMIRN